jgi:hypothetical protein
MKYYKIKQIADQLPLYKKSGWFLIANELWTEKEFNKITLSDSNKNKFDYVEQIEISKNKTYFFFGARFIQTW